MIATAQTSRPTTLAVSLTAAMEWQKYGACRGQDPDVWFPVGSTTTESVRQTEEARLVCYSCPVRSQCLEWAIETRQEYGVWGGKTTQERVSLTRRRARVVALTAAVNQIITERLGEFRALQRLGLSDKEIADGLGTNVQAVRGVRDELAVRSSAGSAVAA